MRGIAITIAGILSFPAIAGAWPVLAVPEPEPEPAPEPEPEPEPAPPPEPAPAPKPAIDLPTTEELLGRIEELETKTKELDKKAHIVDSLMAEVAALKPLRRYITAYIDVGAFVVGGDGSGIRSDFLHTHYPKYRNTISGQWVFMGDPFTTMVNTLGEPADTAASREVKTDTINSSGRPSFIVNTVALDITKDIGRGVSIATLVQFLPRPGPDVLDVPFAYVQYKPTLDDGELYLQAGKVDSVLGVEYRFQDAPRRDGVTPSLICRYTCGRPLGLNARFTKGQLSTSAALINGDNFEERFEGKSELKSSRYPTLAGHLQWTLREIGQGLELGVSGAVGPQDGQSNTEIHQWHYGFDLKLFDFHGWNAVAEFVQGKQQGSTTGDPAIDRMNGVERPRCDIAQCLTYKGAYLLVDHRLADWLLPYARIDWRDAIHRDGAEFVYESHSVRATVGAKLELTDQIVWKLEYNFNHELGVPNFPHDVFTTSIVVSTN